MIWPQFATMTTRPVSSYVSSSASIRNVAECGLAASRTAATM
jgi:hypothetical protein